MAMIRLIIGSIFLVAGLVFFILQILGVFKMKYVLNRMHAAAMGDTLGISAALIGLMIMYGLSFTTLKLALIALFLWCASPVASHLIAALQVETEEDIDKHLERGPLHEIIRSAQAGEHPEEQEED